MRVVLAHGSAITRRRLSRTLRGAGHEVIEAGGAGLALARCRELRPDVLLASLALCDRDEVALLELVKSDPEICHTAVVLIAPRELPLDLARAALRGGAHDFLLEPVSEAELITRVQAAARTKSLQEQLVDEAAGLGDDVFQDPMTHLYGRRFLFDHLSALASGARRHGRPLAVAMVGLDDFEGVRDRIGREAGDRMLVAAAEALQRALRAEDVLGRLGGEEFLALLPDTDAPAADRAAERLRAEIEQLDEPVPLTASVGWAVLAGDERPASAVGRADNALDSARAARRNRVGAPATLPRRR